MRKITIYFWFLLIFSRFCFAEPTEINELINNNKKYDSKVVTIEGEAIGHLMKRGDFAWLNINDNTNAIGVWAEYNLLEKVKFLGKHSVVGDWIRISGIFNSHCSLHGGDTDIHAEELKILKSGSTRHLGHDPNKTKVLVFLTGLLVCLYIIKFLKRLRSKSMSQ